MAAPRKYPDEVRDRAIRLVRDLVDNGDDSITVTGAAGGSVAAGGFGMSD